MAKYIDADLLRREIKRLEKAAHIYTLGCADNETRKFHEGKDFAYQHIGFLIDSLQQEQLDFPTTDEQMKEFLATHPKIKVPEKYKNPDWLFKKQEQQEVDLEKEIETYFKGWYIDETDQGYILHTPDDHAGLMSVKQVARHFFELGKNSK